MNNEYLSRIVSADNVVSAEYVSYHGLRGCLVTYTGDYYGRLTPQVLYLEESVKPLHDKHGITSLDGLAGLGLPSVPGRRETQKHGGPDIAALNELFGFDAPTAESQEPETVIVGTPEDKRWFDSVRREYEETDDGDFFSEDEEDIPGDTVELNAFRDEFAWHDIPFTDASGLQGAKNCWGEVIIPAVYEECRPASVDLSRAVPVRRDGKWGFADRDTAGGHVTDFVFDGIEEGMGNVFIVRRNNCFGIYDGNGEELVPAVMDDISEVTFNKLFLTKRHGKFGFRFNNGVYIPPCVDEIEQPEEECAPLRFRIGDTWKYLSGEGDFSDRPEKDSLRKRELIFTGRISHGNMLEDNGTRQQ